MPEKFPTGTSDKIPNTDKVNKKQQNWENIRGQIEEWRDALGKPIDEKIKDSIIAFNALEIPTGASCEGHLDSGYPVPWIDVEAPGKPRERFVGEKEFFQKIADKYGISLEEVVRGDNEKAWVEAMNGPYYENDETPEYKKWRGKMTELELRAGNLLEEFYKNRQVSEDLKLEIDKGGAGVFRIHNGGKDYEPSYRMSEEQKKGLDERLKHYRVEMEEFTKFLKEKYFSKGK